MKQILLAITLVIFGLSNVTAQTKGDIELGAGVGLSGASVVVKDNNSGVSSTPDNRTTYNIGLSGEYYFSDRWGIKMNAIYDNKGYQVFVNDQEEPIVTALTYITIPLRANWHFGKGEQKKWYLNFGIYAGFLTDFRVFGTSSAPIDNIDDFEKVDFGFDAGIGYKHRLNEKIKLYAELAIQVGAINIFSKNGNFSSLIPDVIFSNTRGAVNVGILYDL